MYVYITVVCVSWDVNSATPYMHMHTNTDVYIHVHTNTLCMYVYMYVYIHTCYLCELGRQLGDTVVDIIV